MGNKSLPKVEIAFRIAGRFPGREPHARELMEEFGLSKTRAYEFKRAMRNARGQVGEAPIQERCAQLSGAL